MLEILKKINKSKSLNITLCGGEPLVAKGVEEVVYRLHVEGNKNIILNTNGELLNREKILSLNIGSYIKTVGISIDGYDSESHSNMRGIKSNLSKILFNINLLKDIPNIRLKIATVVSKKNIDDLLKIGELVQKINPNVWRVYEFSARGQANKYEILHSISSISFELKVAELKKNFPLLNIQSSNNDQTAGCFIIDNKGVIVQPKGAKYTKIGSCLDNDIDEVWNKNLSFKTAVYKNKTWLNG
ncbi:hypothetical protein GCM10028810_20320 [Spirosoma litoris]